MKGCDSVGIPNESAQDVVERALLRLSVFASGRTAPNPSVACLIHSQDGSIAIADSIGGATEPAGRRHAEIVALDALDQFASEHGRFDPPVALTLSVTLEPCCRYGRTPPCVHRISRYGKDSDFAHTHGLFIETVRVAEADPSLHGGGLAALKAAGFDVRRFESTQSFRPFLLPFLRNLERRRPLYTVKVATDPTGLMGNRLHSLSLTGDSGRVLTMRMRAKCDGVMVGPGTVAVDRPSLDLRSPGASPFVESRIEDAARLTDHRRLWFRSLFDPECGWSSLDAADRREEFQPVRIFLLGRPFVGRELFFDRQYALSSATRKEALFLSLRSMSGHWPGATVVPDLDDPAFFRELSELLASKGMHRVLIESGYGLLPYWLRHLEDDDALVHVRRDESIDIDDDDESLLRIDMNFQGLHQLDEYGFAPGLAVRLWGRGAK